MDKSIFSNIMWCNYKLFKRKKNRKKATLFKKTTSVNKYLGDYTNLWWIKITKWKNWNK